MGQTTWTVEALCEDAGVSPKVITALESVGVLVPTASDLGGTIGYAHGALDNLRKAKALLALGYTPEAIAAISENVGLPTADESPPRIRDDFLPLSELSRRTGVSQMQLTQWREKGILRDTRETDDGPMFSMAAIDVVCALKDLTEFGFSQDQLSEWSDMGRRIDRVISQLASFSAEEDPARIAGQVSEASELIEKLRGRLQQLRDGLRRWEKLIGAYDKRLSQLKARHQIVGRQPRGRRRIRVATRRRKLLQTGDSEAISP
jgi:DNA-binding transcriptional MerR regulator